MVEVWIKQSVSDPIAQDIGNKTLQGRTVSNTIQLAMFTTNENAAWAAKKRLQKASYPFASIILKVNRDAFRYEVGDRFVLNYTKYGIQNMVCRILLKEEESLGSENIILTVVEDYFSLAGEIEEYTAPVDNASQPPNYTPSPFVVQAIYDAPYVLTDTVKVISLAARVNDTDLGMTVNMSIDSGASFDKIDENTNIQPHGILVQEKGITYSIDDSDEGILIEFSNDDVDLIQTITWANTLAGTTNLGLINDEIISFEIITPVSGYQYRLTNIIRGRYGTQQAIHSVDDNFWFITPNVGLTSNSNLTGGSSRSFKLVPYNKRNTGSIADATQIDVDINGRALTPYMPINFCANDVSFASRYTSDIILTWSPRKRGVGAGIGTPGTVLAGTDREGLFEIEVWVSSVKVRTASAIDAVTWTYTSAMNISDNGSLASEVEFKIVNYNEISGVTYTSVQNTVSTKLTT